MNKQYNKNEKNDLGTWSNFEQVKYLLVPLEVIFVEHKIRSLNNAIEKQDYKISHEQQKPFVCVLETPCIETREDLN